MANLIYSLGPFEFVSDEGGDRWAPPPVALGTIDLGRLSDYAVVGAPRAMGFFASPVSLGSAYTELGQGDLRELASTALMRSAWQSATGTAVTGATLLDLLLNHLTARADPAGIDTCPPLVPTLAGDLEIHLGGHSKIYSRRFVFRTDPHTPKLRELLRRDLLAVRTASRGRGSDFHQKYLDAILEKYAGRDEAAKDALWAVLRPAAWPANEPRKPHETSQSDDFNRSDSSTLGGSWTEVTGDLQIVSNDVRGVTLGQLSRARWDADLSSADHYSQIDATALTAGTSRWLGPLCRYNSGDDTCYVGKVIITTNGIRIAKCVTGTITDLGSGASATLTGLPKVLKLTCNGSTHTINWDNGAASESLSDSTTGLTANTRCGMTINAAANSLANTRLDNWAAADLAAAGGGGPIFRGRALGRGRIFGGSSFG